MSKIQITRHAIERAEERFDMTETELREVIASFMANPLVKHDSYSNGFVVENGMTLVIVPHNRVKGDFALVTVIYTDCSRWIKGDVS